MNRRVELWNDKEIATTLAVLGAVRTGVGRKIWSKIPQENLCVETCKQVWLSSGSQGSFFKHRSYTGVSTGVRYNSSCTILDALYFAS